MAVGRFTYQSLLQWLLTPEGEPTDSREFFGGAEELEKQMGWVTDACRRSVPRPGFGEVRVPGDRALAMRAEQLERGVLLDSSITEGLEEQCRRAGLSLPEPHAGR